MIFDTFHFFLADDWVLKHLFLNACILIGFRLLNGYENIHGLVDPEGGPKGDPAFIFNFAKIKVNNLFRPNNDPLLFFDSIQNKPE